MDPADRLTLAADRLETALAAGGLPEFLAGRSVFIDEFDTFNAPKKRLMAALLAAAPQVTVSLCADGAPAEEGDLSLFSGGRRVALTLKQLARRAGVGVAAPVLLTEDLRHAAGRRQDTDPGPVLHVEPPPRGLEGALPLRALRDDRRA